LNLSGGAINGEEIVNRVVPVIDVYDEVNVFMREYTKTGFKFEKFKILITKSIKIAVSDPKRAAIYLNIIDSIQAL